MPPWLGGVDGGSWCNELFRSDHPLTTIHHPSEEDEAARGHASSEWRHTYSCCSELELIFRATQSVRLRQNHAAAAAAPAIPASNP